MKRTLVLGCALLTGLYGASLAGRGAAAEPLPVVFADSRLAAEAVADVDFRLVGHGGGHARACDCPVCDPCGHGSGHGLLHSGGLYAEGEVLFFKYHRADGVRAGSFSNFPPSTTDDVRFDYEATPRVTLGYITDRGLGARVRWFEYHQSGDPVFPASGVGMSVNTYTIDFEVFDRIQLNRNWRLEISGGVRYNEFEERMFDPIPQAERLNRFIGWGGIAGVEAERSLGRWGSLYVRGRGAMLMDDRQVFNERTGAEPQRAILTDSTVGMTELALGYKYSRQMHNCSVLSFRAGWEWQNWYNYSSAFTPITTAPGNDPASFAGLSDVGFQGFTLGLIYER